MQCKQNMKNSLILIDHAIFYRFLYCVFVLYETNTQILIGTFMTKKIIRQSFEHKSQPSHDTPDVLYSNKNAIFLSHSLHLKYCSTNCAFAQKRSDYIKRLPQEKQTQLWEQFKKKGLPHKHKLYAHIQQALITFKQIRPIISSSLCSQALSLNLCFYQIRFQRHDAATERLCDHNSQSVDCTLQ